MDFSNAQDRLSKLQEVRTEIIETLRGNGIGQKVKALRNLAAIDRYDRYARTHRRRAARTLDEIARICQNEPN